MEEMQSDSISPEAGRKRGHPRSRVTMDFDEQHDETQKTDDPERKSMTPPAPSSTRKALASYVWKQDLRRQTLEPSKQSVASDSREPPTSHSAPGSRRGSRIRLESVRPPTPSILIGKHQVIKLKNVSHLSPRGIQDVDFDGHSPARRKLSGGTKSGRMNELRVEAKPRRRMSMGIVEHNRDNLDVHHMHGEPRLQISGTYALPEPSHIPSPVPPTRRSFFLRRNVDKVTSSKRSYTPPVVNRNRADSLAPTREIGPGKGYIAHVNQVKQGISENKKMSEFFEQLSTLHHSFGTSLIKLATEYNDTIIKNADCPLLTDLTCKVFQMVHEEGTKVVDNSCFINELSNTFREEIDQLEVDMYSAMMEQEDAAQSVRESDRQLEKEKGKCEVLLEHYAQMENELHSETNDPENQKKKDRYEMAKEKKMEVEKNAFTMCTKHSHSIQAFNSQQTRYTVSTIPSSIDKLDGINERRLANMKKTLCDFVSSQESVYNTLEQIMQAYRNDINSIDQSSQICSARRVCLDKFGRQHLSKRSYDLSRELVDLVTPSEDALVGPHNFTAMLDNNLEILYFERFLQQTYCYENWEFRKDVDEYSKLEEEDERQKHALEIYEMYVHTDGPKMVNLPSGVCASLTEALLFHGQCDATIFDEARTAIHELMEADSYRKFLHSTVYQEYTDKVNEIYNKPQH